MGVALRWACLVFYEDKRFEHVFHPILQNSWWSDDLTFSWPCESRWSENTLNAVSLYTRVLLSLGRVLLSLGFKDLDIVWSARAVLLISPLTLKKERFCSRSPWTLYQAPLVCLGLTMHIFIVAPHLPLNNALIGSMLLQ